jgi:hypothetical protein
VTFQEGFAAALIFSAAIPEVTSPQMMRTPTMTEMLLFITIVLCAETLGPRFQLGKPAVTKFSANVIKADSPSSHVFFAASPTLDIPGVFSGGKRQLNLR